jgi:lipopolysaccharide biosynthesis glycosyltransferase
LDRIPEFYKNCRIQYREVGNEFDGAFEIRGITTPAYYRLLIPELIPEYDKVLYSDVDVLFRDDICDIYNTDIAGCYVGGVNSVAHLDNDTIAYYNKLGLDAKGIIYSGNLIINSKEILSDNIIPKFKELRDRKLRFQDMDMINIVCKDKIKYLPPAFCWTNYINKYSVERNPHLYEIFSAEEIELAKDRGLVHYNGQKPWKGYCVNFDIWWEYYRKSPFYDEKFYFDFFYKKLDELDQLSLLKRIKILVRYFVYGRK